MRAVLDIPRMRGYTRGMSKLTINDPDFFRKIGKMGGAARKRSGADFSEIAKLSHPRAEYKGGRPKGSKNKNKGINAQKVGAVR